MTVFSQLEGRKVLVYLTDTSLFVKGKATLENFQLKQTNANLLSFTTLLGFNIIVAWVPFIYCIFCCYTVCDHGPFICR